MTNAKFVQTSDWTHKLGNFPLLFFLNFEKVFDFALQVSLSQTLNMSLNIYLKRFSNLECDFRTDQSNVKVVGTILLLTHFRLTFDF